MSKQPYAGSISKEEMINRLSYGLKMYMKDGNIEKAKEIRDKIQDIAGTVRLPEPEGPKGIDVPFPQGVIKSAKNEVGKLVRGTNVGLYKGVNKLEELFGTGHDFSNNAQAWLERENKKADAAYEPYRIGNPVEDVVGAVAPYAILGRGVSEAFPTLGVAPVGRIPRMLHFGKAAATSPVAKAAVEGGLFGAMHQDSDAVMGAALGAGGYKVGQFAARPFARVADELTDSNRKTVQWAKEKGFELFPGLKSGNKGLQEIDRALATNINTSDYVNQVNFRNRKLATQIVADKLGLKGVDELDGDALMEAQDLITKEIGKLKHTISSRINVDDQVKFYNYMRQLNTSRIKDQQEAAKELKKVWKHVWDVMAEKTPDRQGGRVLTGEQYQNLRRDWRLAIEKGYKNNATVKDGAFAKGLNLLQQLLNDGVDRQGKMVAGKNDWYKQWQAVNQKQRILMDAEEALTRGNNQYDGLIDPAKLYRMYNNKYPHLMATGKFFDEDLMHLAKLGNLTKTQQGASLQASQQLAKILNSGEGDPKVGMSGLLAIGATKAGPLKRLGLDMYRFGWPFTTGILGLPTGSVQGLGEITSKTALTGMGEDPLGNLKDRAAEAKDTAQEASNAMLNWWDTVYK